MTTGKTILFSAVTDFNSHAHVERDFPDDIDNAGKAISTHTLTWSVTEASREWNSDMTISTHTLTWSVTLSPYR